MSVTVADVLGMQALGRVGATLVAGDQGLCRNVRWVHVSELPDVSESLKGGELLLTTGLGISQDDGVQRDYVDALVRVGAAGLVIQLGRTFAEVPPALTARARGADLPVIALRRPAWFVEITEEIHSAIVNSQYELLRKAEAVGREFTDLVLGGAEVSQILSRLSRIAGTPIVLEDRAHQVVGYAPQDAGSLEFLTDWHSHSRIGHQEAERDRGRVHRETSEYRCVWVSVWIHHELWGRLHVMETEVPLDEMDELALDRAGAAIGLALLSRQEDAHISDRARSALIVDLLEGRIESDQEFYRRAKNLGADLENRQLSILIVEFFDFTTGADELSEHERQRLRLQLLSATQAAVRDTRCSALAGLEGDRILVLVGDPLRRTVRDTHEELADRIMLHSRTFPAQHVVIGASGRAEIASVSRAVQQAKQAAAYGRQVVAGGNSARSLYQFADLGVHHLLVKLAEGPELASFVELELGAILDYDAKSRTRLLPTLRTYLMFAGRKAETARELQVQRRTLYGRLARIEGLVGRSLSEQDTRTRLGLALQGLDLLQQRTPSRRLLP